MEVVVIKKYEQPYADPISVRAGESVKPNFGKETDIAGWVWCTAEDGRSGWAPRSWLRQSSKDWFIDREFNAIELTVVPGELLDVAQEESGFFWVRKKDGATGWVPCAIEPNGAALDVQSTGAFWAPSALRPSAATGLRHDVEERILCTNRALLAILCLGFLIGSGFHIWDNLIYGFLPYTFVPLSINIYWTGLAALDLIAVFLLIKRLRSGLLLALLIMLTDVGTNSYVFYGLHVFGSPIGLQFQSIFLGFAVAASIALWGTSPIENRRITPRCS